MNMIINNLYFTKNHLTKQTNRTHYNCKKYARKLHEHNELGAYITKSYSIKQTKRIRYNDHKGYLKNYMNMIK